MEFPKNLKYTKDHEWIDNTKSSEIIVGVSEYAIDQLGDIVHIELPQEGAEYNAGDSFGTIESTKTVSDLYMPVSGTVIEVNEALEDNPQSLQDDPYGDGWIVKVKSSGGDIEEILSASDYESFIQED